MALGQVSERDEHGRFIEKKRSSARKAGSAAAVAVAEMLGWIAKREIDTARRDFQGATHPAGAGFALVQRSRKRRRARVEQPTSRSAS